MATAIAIAADPSNAPQARTTGKRAPALRGVSSGWAGQVREARGRREFGIKRNLKYGDEEDTGLEI